MSLPEVPERPQNAQIAKSAGLAFLGRLGALIEVIGLPALSFLYGAPTLGIFFTLWSIVRITTTFTEFGMSTSLQRFIPAAKDDLLKAHTILKTALLTALVLGTGIAILFFFLADPIARILNATPADSAVLPEIIRIYIWILPFWTMVEVLTASIRAQRTFGPEIRVRIFYEQILRIFLAIGFYYLGLEQFGLFYAHVLSVILACLLALRLTLKFYDLKTFWKAPLNLKTFRTITRFSIMMTPASMIKRMNSELPLLMLNILLPGANGATAAAMFGIGRRIASVLQVIRQSFEYVVAPHASHHKAHDTHDQLDDMFTFSTRLTIAIVTPIAIMLLAVRKDLLAVAFPDAFAGTASVLLILALGRVLQAFSGPSEAVIEMLGHRSLPFLNGLAGVSLMIALTYILAPSMGAAGAAIGAAVGLNTTAHLSLLEAVLLFRLKPYDKSLLRPLFVTLLATLVMAAMIHFSATLGEGGRIAIAPFAIFLALFLMVRFGLYPQDIDALGKLGQFLKGRSSTKDK